MDKLKVRNKFKPKDNYDVNRERVKREMYKGKRGEREKMISIAKKNQIEAQRKLLQTEVELPSQITTNFISMEGLELKKENDQTSEMVLNTEMNVLDLNKLINLQLKTENEPQIYQFFINDIQIKGTLKETLQKIKDFSSETVYQIVYCPESLFKVKPLTRGGSVLEGHSESMLLFYSYSLIVLFYSLYILAYPIFLVNRSGSVPDVLDSLHLQG